MVKERVRWKGICGKGTRCMENTMMVEGLGWPEEENIVWTRKCITLLFHVFSLHCQLWRLC